MLGFRRRLAVSGEGFDREGALATDCAILSTRKAPMDMSTSEFVRAGSLAELGAKGRLVVHGRHPPTLVIYEGGRLFALDNRCPHMGFPLDRGSVSDGILTCHGHHFPQSGGLATLERSLPPEVMLTRSSLDVPPARRRCTRGAPTQIASCREPLLGGGSGIEQASSPGGNYGWN